MSSEVYGHSSSESLELLGRDVQEIHKQPKFSYTRDFLLSLSELDICKKLPAGFDASLLREFEDSSSNSLHQNRNLGGFHSQSSRNIEYGYVQTNRSDTSSNYSRGSQGRWETRSSGSSDREELQTRDSSGQDTGKHNPNQPRHLWKQIEQNGLLGKPSGYSGQASAQRSRGNGHYTLNKSTEPYQPPRPYKAISHSWRNNSDSINDETFGSSDCSEDRSEEEKKRRASFELMRKEQQKALQEKPKQITDNHEVDLDAFSIASLKDHECLPVLRNKKEDDANIVQLQSDSSRTVQTQPFASRPLVPPGFRSTTIMKNVSALPSETNFASEDGQSGPHILPILSKDTPVSSEVDSILEAASITSSIHTTGSVIITLSNAIEKAHASPISRYSDPPTHQAFGPAQATEGWMDSHVHSYFTDSQDRKSLVNMPFSQDHPKSILDELFQNASKQNDEGLSSFVQEVSTEERWSMPPFTSKFSDWLPEEKKQSEEKSPSKDLFSQFFNNEKAQSQESLVIDGNAAENTDVISSDIIPDEKVVESISSFFPFESEKTSKAFDVNSNIVQTTKDYYAAGKPDASLSVLTCEDLEQSILAEANATGATRSLPPQWHALHIKSDAPTNANDHASQHLRLLLHVGSETHNLTSNFNVQTSEIFNTYDGFGTKPACSNGNIGTSETVEHSSKGHNVKSPLLFEGLFPADVMKGLQSTEGPLSKQMGSADGGFGTSIASQAQEPPSHSIHAIDDPSSSLNQAFGYVSGTEVSELSRISVVPTHQTQESWTGFEASRLRGLTADGTFDINSGFKGLRFPEEEILVGPGENTRSQILDPFSCRNSIRHDEPSRLKSPENIFERSANFNLLYSNHRGSQVPGTEGSHPIHGSFDPADLHPQHPQRGRHAPFVHQNSQTGLPFLQHDSCEFRNAHREFTVPDRVSYDPHHQFPLNTVHPHSFHNVGLQVNQSAHPQILANMPVPGNFPLQELHGFPRGVLSSHSMNHVPHIPEMNLMHGVPMSNRHSSQNDIGLEIPGMEIGGSLGRIFAMDARAARQTHPLAGSHLHGSYTPEVDLGFRYR